MTTTVTVETARDSQGGPTARYESLRRGLQVLGLVQDRGQVTVAELAGASGLPLSTCYRYIAELRDTGFLVDDAGRIAPGPRMAEHSEEKAHLVSVARPVLRQLRDATGLTVLILVRVHTMALCLDWAPAPRRHRIFFGRGQIRPIAGGGSALPLLAFAPPHIIQAVLDKPMRELTTAAPTGADLSRLLQKIRDEELSISHGHITAGLTSIGVPVMVAGRCLCSISLVGEDRQLPPGPVVEDRIAQIRAAAAHIVATLPEAVAKEEWSNAVG